MLNRRGLVGAGAALASGTVLSTAMYDWLHTDPALAADAPVLDDPLTPTPPPTTATRRPRSAPRRSSPWSTRSRCSGPGTPPAAADSSARRWSASSTRWAACSPTAIPTHLQRRLWGVAANLAVLAGWMSHDVGLEPTAQKYFVIAAHAAREGGDRPRAGEALSRAARQMVHLGRPDDALDLMNLAKSGSGEANLPRTRAMLHTIEAWAQASMGDGQADAAHPRRGRGAVRLRQRRRAAAQLDAELRRGRPARHAGAGLPHPGRARAVGGRPGADPRQAGDQPARRRPRTLDDLRLPLARLGLLHRRRPRTGRPLRPDGAAGHRADLLAPHLGPAARDVPAHRPDTPATAASRTCARRSRRSLPRPGKGSGTPGRVPRPRMV